MLSYELHELHESPRDASGIGGAYSAWANGEKGAGFHCFVVWAFRRTKTVSRSGFTYFLLFYSAQVVDIREMNNRLYRSVVLGMLLKISEEVYTGCTQFKCSLARFRKPVEMQRSGLFKFKIYQVQFLNRSIFFVVSLF